MDFDVDHKGFSRLDFDEIKRIALLVGFDIVAVARTKKSCGPGCDWLVQDKRYFTLMLLKHIEPLLQASDAALPGEVLVWYKKAKAASQEYALMEQALYPVLGQNKKQKEPT